MANILSVIVYAYMLCIAIFAWAPIAQELLPNGFEFWQFPLGRGHVGAIIITVALGYCAYEFGHRIIKWIGYTAQEKQP